MSQIKYSKKLKHKMHYCGDGFKGKVIEKKIKTVTVFGETLIDRTVSFCDFCGKESEIR